MARPLDGIALLAYSRRLKLSKETYKLLTHIRSSPPSRTPGARRGNMPVWYPFKKMQCIIKAESIKVEFPFLLAAEHDDDVLEMWDQPPAIPLEYLGSKFISDDQSIWRRRMGISKPLWRACSGETSIYGLLCALPLWNRTCQC